MAGTLYCSIFLYVGKVLVVGTLKGYHQIGGLWSMYVNFLLLLRSLRAWGLGVVLVKVAGSLYAYPEAPDSLISLGAYLAWDSR